MLPAMLMGIATTTLLGSTSQNARSRIVPRARWSAMGRVMLTLTSALAAPVRMELHASIRCRRTLTLAHALLVLLAALQKTVKLT